MKCIDLVKIAVGCTIMLYLSVDTAHGQNAGVAFWNVENFFDTRNDTLKDDDAFTPQGDNHWNAKRFEHKRDNIYKVIAALGLPMVIGLAEVENKYVLEQLCRATPLRKYGYRWIHYDSPDVRGIDCALLFRSDLFKPFRSKPVNMSNRATNYFTRDVLMVGGVTARGDSLYILVCHMPSKLGGDYADRQRSRIARTLRNIVDTVALAHPSATVVVMGDFNADPEEADFRKSFGFDEGPTNDAGLTNLMYGLADGEGSHNYGGHWSFLDQIMVKPPIENPAFVMPKATVFRPKFMLENDDRHQTQRPLRTYNGLKYRGGFSDHLPVYIDF